MEEPSSLFSSLFEKTEQYTRSSIELLKLKALDKSAEVISTLTARLVVIAFFTLFFLILNIGVALWIGEVLGKIYFGFFIVAGFYALSGILFYIFRSTWIKKPVKNSIITQVLN
jgi:hypothetical protein